MRRRVIQLYIKNNEVIFSLAWNIIFFDNFKSSCFEIFGNKEHGIFEPKSWWKYVYWLLKSSCFNLFGNGKYGLFLSQKVDGNMIFTDYWKVLVLTFSEMGNTIFSWAKKLTEIWCLLITGKFLFWTFRWLEIRSFFRVKKLMERWYLLVTENFLFWTFWWWKYGLFSAKMLIERWYLLFELSMIFQDLGNMVFRTVLEIISIFQSFKNLRVDHQIVCNFLFFIQLPFPRN